jgi:hypothetical protein
MGIQLMCDFLSRMTDVFNSREIAISIWVFLFLVWSFTRKDFRDHFLKLLISFTSGIILIPLVLMVIYNMAVVWSLETLGLWRITQLKHTILWFIFTGLAIAYQITDQTVAQSIKRVLKNNVKLIIVLEFVVNAYTFPLVVEIILFPALVMIGARTVMAKYDSKYSSGENFTKRMLSLVGTGIILYVVINIIYDYKKFISISTLHNILLPPILTILFLPFIYILMLYMAYEKLFSRLRIYLRDSKKLQKYAMQKLIIQCKFNLARVQKALGENSYELFDAKSQEDVDRVIFEKPTMT